MIDVTQVLTVAGIDSSGGAGANADLKTFHNQGVYGASVTDSETLVLDSLHGDHTENRLYTTSTLADWVAENVANVNAIIDGYNAAK